MKQPSSIRVRMYNVGFGDCFLLTFRYGAGEDRHVLVDYGSNAMPDGAGSLDGLAPRIQQDCGGKLAAIVLSHRHRDHIAGFDPGIGGKVIAGLKPEVVLRPWTEAPDAKDPPKPGHAFAEQGAFLHALSAAEDVAGELVAAIGTAPPRSLRAGIGIFAARQLKNRDAVEMLHHLSEGGRGRYLSAGVPTNTDDALPGVKISVLGPPLPSQWPAIRRERADDAEYWLRIGNSVPAALAGSEAETAPPPTLGPEAWLVDQLRTEGLHSTMRIVLALDRALNNTSLILLIEAAGRRLLFPGDAQIENWSYSLSGPGSSPELLARLAALDFYKVGHHGSRNATPKLSLLPLWRQAGVTPVPVAFMSTKTGVYDNDRPVPAAGLVTALETAPLTLVNTDAFPPGQTSADIDFAGV